jgi:hypothetical protein
MKREENARTSVHHHKEREPEKQHTDTDNKPKIHEKQRERENLVKDKERSWSKIKRRVGQRLSE